MWCWRTSIKDWLSYQTSEPSPYLALNIPIIKYTGMQYTSRVLTRRTHSRSRRYSTTIYHTAWRCSQSCFVPGDCPPVFNKSSRGSHARDRGAINPRSSRDIRSLSNPPTLWSLVLILNWAARVGEVRDLPITV